MKKISSAVKTAARHIRFLPPILNSVINPIIYTVKNKEFRIGFIELLLRKSYQEASALEQRILRAGNNAVGPHTRHRQAEIKRHEQNGQGRNQVPREDNPGPQSQFMYLIILSKRLV